MRVALIHDWLTGMRGGEKCLEVFCELFPRADLYTLIVVPEKLSRTIRAMHIRPSWLNGWPGIKSTYRYYLPFFPAAIESFDLRGYDLILSSSHCVAKGVVPRNALHIAYIHAPMRYVWDQYDAYFKDAGALSRLGMKAFRRYLQSWDVRSSKRVAHFIANSNNVAAKVRSLYNRECATIYPPVELDRFGESSIGRDYYLVVSALVPYKRVDLAVQACNELRVPLKIVGDGPLRKKLEQQAGPQVEFLGHIDDQTLARLYSGSRALLFPGEEDFGIVALEAQASGRPVIAFGRGGALETVRAFDADSRAPFSTGIFFHELTAASLLDAMCRFEKHIDVFDPAAIRAHANKFSRVEFKRRIEQFIAEKLAERK